MSDNHETLRTMLRSEVWTESEKHILKWQFRMLGDFDTALMHCIALADEDCLARLQSGFLEEVQGFRAWSQGDLARRFRAEGLAI